MYNRLFLSEDRYLAHSVLQHFAVFYWLGAGFQILQVSLAVGESYQVLQGKEAARTRERKPWRDRATGSIIGKEGKGEGARSREEVQE